MTDAPTRTDIALVREGLARSRADAAALVRAGRVRVAGVVVAKPSSPLPAGAAIEVTGDEGPGFASRAALKLGGALDALGARGPQVEGTDCLDVGASTGGFTDLLLRRGARRVLAVDVGHGQLVPALRADPRVIVREGLNARDLTRADVPEPPDVVVADLSFISLRTVLPALVGVIKDTTDLLLMVKPQFEVGRERLGRGGVVRSPALHESAVTQVAGTAQEHGLAALAVVPSALPGPSGNREYFLWLHPGLVRGDVVGPARAATAWDPGSGSSSPVCWVGEPGPA